MRAGGLTRAQIITFLMKIIEHFVLFDSNPKPQTMRCEKTQTMISCQKEKPQTNKSCRRTQSLN